MCELRGSLCYICANMLTWQQQFHENVSIPADVSTTLKSYRKYIKTLVTITLNKMYKD